MSPEAMAGGNREDHLEMACTTKRSCRIEQPRPAQLSTAAHVPVSPLPTPHHGQQDGRTLGTKNQPQQGQVGPQGEV